MNFTIESFWKNLLSARKSGTSNAVKGWKHIEDSLPTFVEAPISLVEGFVDDNPYNSDVILVSAPGAVGKSTLAREIAYNNWSDVGRFGRSGTYWRQYLSWWIGRLVDWQTRIS